MEKYFTLVVALSFVVFTNAQDSLCVFKTENRAVSEFKSKKQILKKGDFLIDNSKLYLENSGITLLIDEDGGAYRIDKAGVYSYKDVLKNKFENEKKNLTSQYFKLIWKELTNKTKSKTVIGGVFRGENMVLFPADSSAVAGTKITFDWKKQNDTKYSFLFLKNKKSDDFLKFRVEGSSISISKNLSFFAQGNTYEWFVSESEFPNLKNARLYSFEFISRNEYQKRKAEYEGLVADLKALNFDSRAIGEELCKVYGLCKN